MEQTKKTQKQYKYHDAQFCSGPYLRVHKEPQSHKDQWVDLCFNVLNKKERIFMFAVLKNLNYNKESDNDKGGEQDKSII